MADRKQIASFSIDDIGANAIDGSDCYVIYDPFRHLKEAEFIHAT